ncbi:MAG: GAF domain-containing protein [Candidatus Obscuribacter sp.]|nr:GAF domain-containing protein [Candidatus Obscuribacter sp.]MBP6349439.1 GAF domain-containing protein [Candidatus Obscuribacter sp.]MBP6592495.1 GAF domain-containing protein [Candidatus Obscuribacter sp.]
MTSNDPSTPDSHIAIVNALRRMKQGDLTFRMPPGNTPESIEVAQAFNELAVFNQEMVQEIRRVSKEISQEGQFTERFAIKGAAGSWEVVAEDLNALIKNLIRPIRDSNALLRSVIAGDLTETMPLQYDAMELKGEFREVTETTNKMVAHLDAICTELNRVAREVGLEGKLGGQARLKGASGTWKELTDNVNLMATNLTDQVRNIATVVSAVANGNLKRKLMLLAKGEIAELVDTINSMIDTLDIFADQVTSVAREVGVEGKLGAQARVPGASGLWRDLTDNVNQLADNLTIQVRAISDVAKAVTKGDLTRQIGVAASGEVASLKDNINEMIRNLQDTTLKNTEQNWLKTNLTMFARLMQGQRDLWTVSNLVLAQLAPLISSHQGAFYILDAEENDLTLRLLGSYANQKGDLPESLKLGEGLLGQCAMDRQPIVIENVPQQFFKVNSSLGVTEPGHVAIFPVLFEGQLLAVIEVATLHHFAPIHLSFIEQLTEDIGIVLNTIQTNTRTEDLLAQSQTLAKELRQQQMEMTETNKRLEQQTVSLQKSQLQLRQKQDELEVTNLQLEERATQVLLQKEDVEQKRREIERAHRALEEKAEQLALTSKYKSQFLANMSHELRTPLNSLLVLSQILLENNEGNLTQTDIDFLTTIYDAGSELLELINDILDISKIESGTVSLNMSEVILKDLITDVERSFRQSMSRKNIEFSVELDSSAPYSLQTDAKRLNQVLKNLLSNAFKFTNDGSVKLKVERAIGSLQKSTGSGMVKFSVIDTGIGIPEDKRSIIFEAFHQADGTTSRKYGGTGLGLAISKQIVEMLGGYIVVDSVVDKGSTFTFYLPATFVPRDIDINIDLDMTIPDSAIREITRKGPGLNQRQFTNAEALNQAFKQLPGQLQEANNAQALYGGAAAGSRNKSDKPIILIIEEDIRTIQALEILAEDEGYVAQIADSTQSALAYASNRVPDAIILDVNLERGAGWSLLRQLKSCFDKNEVPTQLISSFLPEKLIEASPLELIEPQTTVASLTIKTLQQTGKNGQGPTVLIIEPDQAIQQEFKQHLAQQTNGGKVNLHFATSVEQAQSLHITTGGKFDSAFINLAAPVTYESVKDFLWQRNVKTIGYAIKAIEPNIWQSYKELARPLKDATTTRKDIIAKARQFLLTTKTKIAARKTPPKQSTNESAISPARQTSGSNADANKQDLT